MKKKCVLALKEMKLRVMCRSTLHLWGNSYGSGSTKVKGEVNRVTKRWNTKKSCAKLNTREADTSKYELLAPRTINTRHSAIFIFKRTHTSSNKNGRVTLHDNEREKIEISPSNAFWLVSRNLLQLSITVNNFDFKRNF